MQDRSVLGLEPSSGRTLFLTPLGGDLTDLTAFAGHAFAVGKATTSVLDPSGRVVDRLPGYLTVDVTATHLVDWATDHVDVLDPGGRVVASWPTSSVSLVSSERPGLATPQGIYLFAYTRGWTFAGWTTGG